MQPVHPSARCVSAWWWLQVWAPVDRMVQRVRGQWTTSLLLTGSPRRRRSARWCCCRHAAAGSHRRAGLCRQRCRILCRVPGCCAVRTVWEPGATMQGSLRASAPRCAVVAALCRSRRLYRSVVVAGKHWLKGSSSRHVLAVGEGRRAAARACAAADVRHRWLAPHSMGAWRCRPRLQRIARCWQGNARDSTVDVRHADTVWRSCRHQRFGELQCGLPSVQSKCSGVPGIHGHLVRHASSSSVTQK